MSISYFLTNNLLKQRSEKMGNILTGKFIYSYMG